MRPPKAWEAAVVFVVSRMLTTATLRRLGRNNRPRVDGVTAVATVTCASHPNGCYAKSDLDMARRRRYGAESPTLN